MTAELEADTMPDNLTEAPESPPTRRGRPPKAQGSPPNNPPPVATSAPSGDDEEPTAKPEPRQPKPRHQAAFDLLTIGDTVQYWICGTREDIPMAALITRKHKSSKSFDLTTFVEGEMRINSTKTGVRHIDDPEYPEMHRVEQGAWEPTLQTKILMDLTKDGRRN